MLERENVNEISTFLSPYKESFFQSLKPLAAVLCPQNQYIICKSAILTSTRDYIKPLEFCLDSPMKTSQRIHFENIGLKEFMNMTKPVQSSKVHHNFEFIGNILHSVPC